ncbi:MAG TPA: tetratricopeptide repeat protein [Bryobacteraceae bacterium]|nr:tetratricopeptide repeat protein [Bryobacteraceae bacterium]
MNTIPELTPVIARLREDLVLRRIESGMRTLEAHRPLLEALQPVQKHAAVLVGLVAQWVDIGFAGPELLRDLLTRFPQECRVCLPLLDYLHLRMAEGLLAMAAENVEQAVRHLQFVQSTEGEIQDPELLAISNFWIGRCLRKEGRYDDALAYAVKGKTLALERGYVKMAAVMQVMESWMVFQKGKLKEAGNILRLAEAALSDTDDFVSRGNIQSAYGRIARRQGRYERALEHFECAIGEYQRRDPQHLNLARSLVNVAFVKRLIALDVHKAIDEDLARRRSASPPEAALEMSRTRRAQIQQLRSEATAHLSEALRIYHHRHNHRGIGSVHINHGFLLLDEGALDRAAAQAAEAFRHGEEKHDYILMARARTLQCSIENARVEEEIEENSAHHLHLAHDYAREAVDYAKQTQNRRLLARALVWQGLTYCADGSENREAARRCCDAATALLRPAGLEQEYVWADLESLRARVLHSGRVNALLQEWSQGLTGDKTFQQITDDFAALVIPQVWQREERKISRVAMKLSISPKKVRRILTAAGMIGGARQGTARL